MSGAELNHQPGMASAEVFHDHGRTVIRVDGELDMATVPMLESVLKAVGDARPQAVVLDVHSVGFMDSAGVKAIVAARDRLAARGRTLQVRNGSPSVERIFELTGATL